MRAGQKLVGVNNEKTNAYLKRPALHCRVNYGTGQKQQEAFGARAASIAIQNKFSSVRKR